MSTTDNEEASIEWLRKASCRSMDASYWDATPGEFETPKAKIAKDICNSYCPVRITCLTWALETEEVYGILGGLLPRERLRLRKVTEHGNNTTN